MFTGRHFPEVNVAIRANGNQLMGGLTESSLEYSGSMRNGTDSFASMGIPQKGGPLLVCRKDPRARR